MLRAANSTHSYPVGPRQNHRQSGISMIEILLSVFVLAVGFLAAAKMQSLGVRNAQGAYVRSQAAFLTKDMADRMRANSAGVDAGFYNNFDTQASIHTQAACVTATNSGIATACTSAQIAQNDLAEWTRYINPPNPQTMLPLLTSGATVSARGTVTLENDRYLITLTWSEVSEGDELPQSMVTEFVP